MTLTDIKSVADFRPTTPNHQNDAQSGRHLDFYFELPTRTSIMDGTFRSLPLSGVSVGTINLTPSHSLNDHQVIHGECEVSYWIEAKFRRANIQVAALHHQIQIRSLYPRLRVSLPKSIPLTLRAKPDILTRVRLQKSPDFSVTLPESEMVVERDIETGKRRISLPLAIAMSPSDTVNMHSRQSLTCDVEAKWLVNIRFSNTSGRKTGDKLKFYEVVQKSSTASVQKATTLFRPFPQYEEIEISPVKGQAPQAFIATSQLDLSVPDAVSQPSLEWRHLTRTYSLQLSLRFRGGQGAPNYRLDISIPLCATSYGSKADDAALGQIAVDDLESITGPNEADDLLEMLGPLGVDERPQPRPQRATRTPPPPYFR